MDRFINQNGIDESYFSRVGEVLYDTKLTYSKFKELFCDALPET